MRNLNFLRKSERKSVGTTLALTVGSPSAHRRYSALKHLAFMLLFLLGSLNVWGEDAVTFTFNTDAGLTALGITKPAASNGTNLGSDTYTLDPVNMSATDGSTATRVWNSSGTLDLRIYKNGGSFTFSVPEGYYLTSVVLAGSAVNPFSVDAGSSGTFSAGTWTAANTSTTSVKLNATNTGKINTITVNYESTGGGGCDKKVNITKGTPANGDFTLSKSGEQATCDGNVQVVVTPTPAEHYKATGVTAPNSSSISAPDEDGKYTVTYAQNTKAASEINVTFTLKDQHTVTWNNHGIETTSQVYDDEKPVFPSPNPTSCDATSITFIGWADDAWEGKATNLEDSKLSGITIYTSASAMPAVTGAVTYYAVYAKVSGTTGWVETAIGDLTSSDVFVFSDGSYALNNDGGASNAPTANAITVSAGKITSPVTDNLKWNISGNATDGYTFYPNGDSETWLYCNTTAASSSNNNMRVGTGDRKVFVFDNAGVLVTDDSNVDRYLCRYQTQDFRGYINKTTTNTTPVVPKFYKYSAGTTSDYMTTCAAAGTCEAPSFSPAAGTFDAAQDITLQTSTPSAHIYYTLDGTDPDDGSDEYSTPIHITQNTIIKAITYADELTKSSISEGVFNIRYAQPTIATTATPVEEKYTSAIEVTITATDADHIYYTTNGNAPEPGEEGTLEYNSAISLSTNGSHTIKAIAVKAGYANSNVASATFVLDLPYATIADFIASGTGSTVKKLQLTNAYILGVNGKSIYVQDATAGIIIFNNSGYGSDSWVADLVEGNQINGVVSGTNTTFNGQLEMASAEFVGTPTITAGTRPTPADITAINEAAFTANAMKLVKVSGVYYQSGNPSNKNYIFTADEDGLETDQIVYDQFEMIANHTMVDVQTQCDVIGIMSIYSKGTTLKYQLIPILVTDIAANADAAAPEFTPEGGATKGEALQVDLNSYVAITAADANHSVDITSAQITTTDPMSVTAVSSRDFYRSTSVTKWYYGNAASASYDINGQGATTEGTIVAQVNSVDASSAKENDEVHILITPNAHFELATIKVNGNDPTEVSAGTEYRFTMPAEAVTIAVTWNEDAKVNVQFAKGKEAAEGTVPSTMSGKYENDVITLPANPFTLTSWKFKGWKHSLTDAIHQPGSYTITAADVAEDAITFAAEWEAMPDFAGGDWMLVTDVAELTEGSYVIIAAANYDKAMKGHVSGNNCGSEDATKEGNLLSYNSNFAIYEIGENVISETTYKTFQNVASENYLFCNTGSTNTLKEQTTINASASWSVEISTAELTLGEAAITNQYASTRSIRYNSSGMFATYTSSGQTPIVLYKYHVPSLKLTYDKNAGDDVVTGMPSMGIADGENKVTISDATPLREGYLFDGWNSNPLGGGTAYAANAEVTLDANLTIYAQWQTATAHSLSYDKDGGEGDVPAATNYYPNADVTLANAVTKDGYIFAGWEYDGNVYAAGSHFAMPNEDVVMTAKFAQGTVYTITAVDAVSAQGALEGSNATFVNTYTNNKNQMTKDNSMTLTLSGYDLYTIKALTLRMRSNTGGGKGTLSVTIGGNAVSFTTNKWYDGDHHTDSYEDIQVMLSPTRVMPGENVVIKIEASLNSLYCQSFAIEYERVLDDIRTSLSDGKWGTICPKQEVKYPSGAVFYQLTYMEQNPDNSPYKFFFDEIAEGASLEAGKPYLFIAEGEVIKGIKVGLEAADGDHAYNGFVGYLGTSNKPLASADYIFTDGGYNYYGLQNNIFKLIGSGQIVNERAYVEVSPDRAPSTTPVPMPAPGRRRLSVGAGAPQIATGLEDGELMNDGMVKKVLINGELFIIRGEKMYDATGRIVK